ncbi:sensor histidine kinase [Primorskyibacter aestuariivivens]|uniref:sensor histidine kinase n=1 Tax=Primorskyibacter aestuariivivens TaxID=1888912 RepID=UPI0023014B47|nr:sensor histidine kinase [Primorskyibacter aestuariivivens]MDA7430482.1 sensor histidine kinase [Primorskyibacter aestuariivivens]
MQAAITFFQDLGYMAHGMCLLWQPWLIALFAGSDFLIFMAYSIIPVAIYRVMRGRPDLENRGLAWLFAAFIALCGLTHLISIVTLWVPVYALHGLAKLATGIVSLVTAAVLFPLVPRIIALPSPAHLRDANAKLSAEIAAHEDTLADLRRARDALEDTVAERTRELARTNEELNIVLRQAGHRADNLAQVTAALARQTAQHSGDKEDFLDRFLARLDAMAATTDDLTRGGQRLPHSLLKLARHQLRAHLEAFPNRISIQGDDEDLNSEAARQIALALDELATNSVKHGALRDDDGKVYLRWDRTGGEMGQPPQLDLQWIETRPEAVPATTTTAPPETGFGYGSRVLNLVVPQRLGGQADADFSTGALAYSLSLPLERIAPQGQS